MRARQSRPAAPTTASRSAADRAPGAAPASGGTAPRSAATAQRRLDALTEQAPALRRPDARGVTPLPPALQAGVEQLSGVSLDDVRVHHDSAAPARVAAHAYAQGADIHLAPGQAHHLPHEAWHVVQQRQGRVRPTTAVGGTPVNDDASLEREADRMGHAAARRAHGGDVARAAD